MMGAYGTYNSGLVIEVNLRRRSGVVQTPDGKKYFFLFRYGHPFKASPEIGFPTHDIYTRTREPKVGDTLVFSGFQNPRHELPTADLWGFAEDFVQLQREMNLINAMESGDLLPVVVDLNTYRVVAWWVYADGTRSKKDRVLWEGVGRELDSVWPPGEPSSVEEPLAFDASRYQTLHRKFQRLENGAWVDCEDPRT